MVWSAESEPLGTMRDLLDENWQQVKEVPKPDLIIANDPDDPRIRSDAMAGDSIVINTGGAENIRYRGNITYYDRSYPITLEIVTKESCQRLRDIWKMIKMILFTKKHNFNGYQLIRIISYVEMVNEDINVWRSIINISLDSAGVMAESL